MPSGRGVWVGGGLVGVGSSVSVGGMDVWVGSGVLVGCGGKVGLGGSMFGTGSAGAAGSGAQADNIKNRMRVMARVGFMLISFVEINNMKLLCVTVKQVSVRKVWQLMPALRMGVYKLIIH